MSGEDDRAGRRESRKGISRVCVKNPVGYVGTKVPGENPLQKKLRVDYFSIFIGDARNKLGCLRTLKKMSLKSVCPTMYNRMKNELRIFRKKKNLLF